MTAYCLLDKGDLMRAAIVIPLQVLIIYFTYYQ
jgi:hypothetical protein